MRVSRIVIVILLACLALWWFAFPHDGRRAKPVSDLATTGSAQPQPAEAAAKSTAIREGHEEKPTPAQPTLAAGGAPVGKTTQNAYRLALEKDHCTLEAVEAVTGNFRPVRLRAWQPGMLCCRLLDRDNAVVAEQTLPAPDFSCVVLDSHVPDEKGAPKAVHLTPSGPAIFQIRFPQIASAVAMKIYRLSGQEQAPMNAEPAGQLLATITLSP